MTPLVGITVCIDRGQRLRAGADYLYVRRAYAAELRRAGAEPILITPDTSPRRAAAVCDAIVISGGDDLPTSLSASGSSAPDHAEDAERIAWERALLGELSVRAKPVLGICYGMQLINLVHGGTLYRNVREQHPGALDHGGGPHTTRHALSAVEPSPLLSGLSAGVEVNSCHRQAVREVAPGFRVTALTSDGIVEAMERAPFYAVGWHPETDPASTCVYDNFVTLVQGVAKPGATAGGAP